MRGDQRLAVKPSALTRRPRAGDEAGPLWYGCCLAAATRRSLLSLRGAGPVRSLLGRKDLTDRFL